LKGGIGDEDMDLRNWGIYFTTDNRSAEAASLCQYGLRKKTQKEGQDKVHQEELGMLGSPHIWIGT
jgi:hypothetical protein